MDDLKLLQYDSLSNYFKYIENTGYSNDTNIYQLLLLDFFDSFIKDYSEYIDEDVELKIVNTINCLYSNSCLIGWDKCTFELPIIKQQKTIKECTEEEEKESTEEINTEESEVSEVSD